MKYTLEKYLLSIFSLLILFKITNTQPTPSDNCQIYNNNFGVCQVCNDGFYLEIYFCIPCKPRCKCSSPSNYCESCMLVQIYYPTDSTQIINIESIYSSEQNQCLLCNQEIQYCQQCNDTNYCLQCYGGKYLVIKQDLDGVTTSQQCSSDICVQNCQTCQNSTRCARCYQGYFLFPNKTCSLSTCIDNCSICQTQNSCFQCASGYFVQTLSDGSKNCQSCMSNCNKCNSSTSCSQCAPSYNYVSGSCTNNGLSNCVSYAADFSICLECQLGYEVTAGSCNQCSGCQTCTQQFICTSKCLDGFIPFNYACVPKFQETIKFAFLLISLYLLLF